MEMEALCQHIRQVVALTFPEESLIKAKFRTQSLAKGESWVRAGTVCHQVAFLHTGRLRVHYLSETGQDNTCHFVAPGRLISSFTSFLTNTPTQETISAIDDSVLWTITKAELEQLSSDIPALHVWRRVIAENLFIDMERRIEQLQSKTAAERYEQIIRENPDIILNVPLQYTASFIGVTPQHLSRLRKETIR